MTLTNRWRRANGLLITVPDDPPEILLPLTLSRVLLFEVRPHPLDDLGWILLIPPLELGLDDRVGNLASPPGGMDSLNDLVNDLMVLGRELLPEGGFVERGGSPVCFSD